MKKQFLTLMMFTVLFSGFAEAGRTASPNTSLAAPQWIYTELVNSFPTWNEDIGGFSTEIQIDELICSTSNVAEDETTFIQTLCTATNRTTGLSETVSAPDLFLALLNAGVKIDRTSEAGTTYITLNNIECSLIDPKVSDPSEIREPVYSCSYTK